MQFARHDELHAISDLHMGGRPGFQILRETGRLAGYVRWVMQQNPKGSVALVLNGDIFDSLAEEIDGYVAVEQAVPMLERIFADPHFAPVWDALADFVKAPGRTLVLVIGNHDIELAFPAVQRAIVARVAGDDPAARGRIEFSTFGAGYACVVGGARVFCTHGNEVDAWNYVRYEDLSRAARRLTAGRALDASEWQPNAGTKLVKDVMNRVKRQYAWIDLLKPEVQAALGVLLVLDPSQLAAIERVLPAVVENVRGRYDYNKRLSTAAVPGSSSPAASANGGADRLLGPELRAGMRGNERSATRNDHEILLDLERTWESGEPSQGGDGTLGAGELVWNRLTGWLRRTDEADALRRALKDWLRDDRTYAIDERDDTFRQVTENVGLDVDYIVTGHTHLARAIDMGGGRHYYNCGTWIRLMQFTDAILGNADKFKQVYEVLKNGTMKAIDDAEVDGVPLVLPNRTSAVCIRADAGGARGELAHITGDGSTREVAHPAVKGR